MTAQPTPSTDHIDFAGLDIAYDARVLRPRAWTVEQSLWAERLLAEQPEGPVLELCAGAGQIGLRAVRHTDRRLVCVEADPVAAAYAVQNAEAAGMADRVEVRQGPMTEVLAEDETFVHVLADPPYLTPAGMADYPEDPPLAVDGGEDGLALARTCLEVIDAHLRPGGTALLQLRDTAQAATLARRTAPRLRAGDVADLGDGVVLRLDAAAGR